MLKRLSALTLVLTMLLVLCSCGKEKAGSDKGYASSQPMDVFAAIEAVRELKDFTYDLRVSDVDPDSGEAGDVRYTVHGAWYTSVKQASAQIKLSNGTALTTLTVDGADLYADLGTAASVLSARFEQIGSGLYADDMVGARKRLKEDYVHFTFSEDPWSTLESGRLSGSRESLKKLYEKVKRNNAKRVRMEEHTGKLSLGLGDLQGTVLDITGDLNRNRALYVGELSRVLEEDFGSVLAWSGMDAEGLLNEKWFLFQDTEEELAQLQSDGDINGWTAKLLSCGDEEHGYSLDLTLCFDSSVNCCLSVYPAQAQSVKTPAKYVEAEDVAESAYLIYQEGKEYLKHPGASEEEASGEQELTDEEAEDYFGLEDLSTAPVSTQSMEGSTGLITTTMYTHDGAERTVPLLAKYEKLRSEEGGDRPADVSQSSDGYVLEYSVIKKRDLAEAAAENAQIYAREFRETWGHDIIREATDSVRSASGDVAAAGMAYHDVDLDQDITVITCCLNVENSGEMLYFDLFTYSKNITKQELRAINELMGQLGVELPLEIIKK